MSGHLFNAFFILQGFQTAPGATSWASLDISI